MENENYILKEKVSKTAHALQTIESLSADLKGSNKQLDDHKLKLSQTQEDLRLNQRRLDEAAVGTFLVRLELMRASLFPKQEKPPAPAEQEVSHKVKVIHEYPESTVLSLGKSYAHPHKVIYKSVAEALHPQEHFTYNDPRYSAADNGNYKSRIDAIFSKVREDKDVSLIVEAMPPSFRNPYYHAAYQYIVDNHISKPDQEALEKHQNDRGAGKDDARKVEGGLVEGQSNQMAHSRITASPLGQEQRAVLEIPLQDNRMEPGRHI